MNPMPEPVVPAEGDPTVVRTVDPDGFLERISVWWSGDSIEDIAWVETIFGPRNWRMTGERRVAVVARPQTLGGMRFSAPIWQPDPATLEIRVGDEWVAVPHGVWLTGNRPYQPKVRVTMDSVYDSGIARTIEAIASGEAEVTMTVERRPDA